MTFLTGYESAVCSLRISAKTSLFSTFTNDVVEGVHSAISKAAAGPKLSQTAKCHANGKELQKDLRKRSARVKRWQRSINADKHEQMHLEIKQSKRAYCMVLNIEMAVMAQERDLKLLLKSSAQHAAAAKKSWALSGRKKEGIL